MTHSTARHLQHARIGTRQTAQLPARLTWRDASGTLRFASVTVRDVSDVDAFVECQVAASIPLHRLVHIQVERTARDGALPRALSSGKVLSAIYRIGAFSSTTGTPTGYGLRLLVDPHANAGAARPEGEFAIAN